jgi:hypothetical protein
MPKRLLEKGEETQESMHGSAEMEEASGAEKDRSVEEN